VVGVPVGRVMPTSIARVLTATPDRYAKQLVAHLGHRVAVEEGPDGARLTFDAGVGTVRAEPDAVVLVARADDADGLARVQDVLARHLERFGQRQELVVAWGPTD
jgi:uncharacterized protein